MQTDRRLSKDDALELYHRTINVCISDEFIIEINGKKYQKDEISYEFLIKNAHYINSIESSSIENSKIYASNFVQIIIALSLSRESNDAIKFVKTPDEIVILIYNTIIWCLDCGYNSAISDANNIIKNMSKFKSTKDAI